MKFWDILRISCKNLWNNKLRTILVWFVLVIMSTLVMLIMSVGLGVIDFVNAIDSDVEKPDMEISYFNDIKGDGLYFDNRQIDYWRETVQDKFPLMKNIQMSCVGKYGRVSHSFVLTDMNYNMFEGKQNYLLDGRMWNSSDKGQPFAWVNKVYADYHKISLGQKIDFEIDEIEFTGGLIVKGIVDFHINQYDNSPLVICDYIYMQNMGAAITEIKFEEIEGSEGYTFSNWQKLKRFEKAHNKFVLETNEEGVRVQSSAYSYDFLFLMMIAALIFMIVISMVVLLLSIGAVSNSIQITVEQNSQFFGMMKAIGMKNSTFHNIVNLQSVLIILFAVGAATAITAAILPSIASLFTSMFSSMGAGEVILPLPIPIYLPFVVVAILIAMVILWTVKSLKSITQKDVISMINEGGQ